MKAYRPESRSEGPAGSARECAEPAGGFSAPEAEPLGKGHESPAPDHGSAPAGGKAQGQACQRHAGLGQMRQMPGREVCHPPGHASRLALACVNSRLRRQTRSEPCCQRRQREGAEAEAGQGLEAPEGKSLAVGEGNVDRVVWIAPCRCPHGGSAG